MHAAQHLKNLLASGRLVQAPGAPDALTARLVQRAGFPAIYMTGFGATASRLGQPDIGLLTQTEMCTHARDMVRAVGIPVVADADTGYGGPSNIARTVDEYLQAGVAAIHLEDQVAPKRCGQMAGIRLIDARENERRLRCAVAARGDRPLLIIGRTDALPTAGMDEAVSRAARWREAGVDLVFVDGVKTRAELEAIARRVDGPKVASLVDGTDAAAVTATELEQMGFTLALYAVTTLFAATMAAALALQALKQDGAPQLPAEQRMSYAEFSELVDLPRHQQLDDAFGTS